MNTTYLPGENYSCIRGKFWTCRSLAAFLHAGPSSFPGHSLILTGSSILAFLLILHTSSYLFLLIHTVGQGWDNLSLCKHSYLHYLSRCPSVPRVFPVVQPSWNRCTRALRPVVSIAQCCTPFTSEKIGGVIRPSRQ